MQVEKEAEALKTQAAALTDAASEARAAAAASAQAETEAKEEAKAAKTREVAAQSRETALEGRLTELEEGWKADLARAEKEKSALVDIIRQKEGCPTLEQLQFIKANAAVFGGNPDKVLPTR